MPNGQFPMPPSAPSFDENIPLTDPVAPALPTNQAEPSPEPKTEPKTEPKPEPQKPTIPEPKPATLPRQASGRSKMPIILGTISIFALAASYFFYTQTKSLTQQINELGKTLENQQTTPTPTESISPETSPIPSQEVIPTSAPTSTISATPTVSTDSKIKLRVLDQLDQVISMAQKQYPKSELLMVTVNNSLSDNEYSIKYWFRQSNSEKKYLYILKESGKDLSLVDQQVYVTPDNNIPSLNQLALNGQLGVDLNTVIKIALDNCPSNFKCESAQVSSQFIKANTTLWQITFRSTSSEKPYVIQIDSITEKILYKSTP